MRGGGVREQGLQVRSHSNPSSSNDGLTQWLRFYYADERNADGSPAYGALDGRAHGEFYTKLAEGTSQGPWQQTFVKDFGYKKF